MSVSGIGSTSRYTFPASGVDANRTTSSSFADAVTATSRDASQSGGAGVQNADFTRMTRKGLAEWVNSKIRSGEMSLDGTETFVSMTLSIAVDGSLAGVDDTKRINFMQSARDGMAWAQQHGDAGMSQRLQDALETMQRYQDQISNLDLTGQTASKS